MPIEEFIILQLKKDSIKSGIGKVYQAQILLDLLGSLISTLHKAALLNQLLVCLLRLKCFLIYKPCLPKPMNTSPTLIMP